MNGILARIRAIAAVGLASILAACDAAQPGNGPPPPTTAELTLVSSQVNQSGRISYVMALNDSVSGGSGLNIGSFRVAIHFDSAAMDFERLTGADILLTAANDVGGRVLVAGASAQGFGVGGWLALEFTPRNAGIAPASPTIEILDLGDLAGADVRLRVAAKPAYSPK
ncbi:MAG TPA: hypothetical protein VJR92_11895 [Gemmatimonadaceae bacterium]|nr:hypothetical protein [Gemmatimonadaceae bacterium]